LETLPGVDERIALTGLSLGEYIAIKVVVHEKRVKALIPNSPIIDGFSDHCQLDNRSRGNQIMFDWLDEAFNYVYEPLSSSRDM
jgi:cephalosporin-C deacetylase-like acetyl esterase